jgi:hypothetical protein
VTAVSSSPKILVRNYNPETDFSDIKTILSAADMFIEGQDSKDRLDDFVSRVPSAVIVAHFEGSHTIEGVVYTSLIQPYPSWRVSRSIRNANIRTK